MWSKIDVWANQRPTTKPKAFYAVLHLASSLTATAVDSDQTLTPWIADTGAEDLRTASVQAASSVSSRHSTRCEPPGPVY